VVLASQFNLKLYATMTHKGCFLQKGVTSHYNLYCLGQCTLIRIVVLILPVSVSLLHKAVIGSACIRDYLTKITPVIMF